MEGGPYNITHGNVFRALTGRKMGTRRIINESALAMKEVNSSSKFLHELLRLLRELRLRCRILTCTNDLCVIYNGFIYLQTIIMAMCLVHGFAFLTIIVMCHIRRLLIGVRPLLRDRLLTRCTQDSITYGRHHFSKGNSQAARQICRIAFTAPTNRRCRTNNRRLVRQNLCYFLTVATTIRQFTTKIRERHAFNFNGICIRRRIQFISARTKAFTNLLTRVIRSNVLRLMKGRLKVARLFARCGHIRNGNLIHVRVIFPSSNFGLFMGLINVLNYRIFSKFRCPSNYARTRIYLMRRFLVAARECRTTTCFCFINTRYDRLLYRCLFRSLRNFNGRFGELFTRLYVCFV